MVTDCNRDGVGRAVTVDLMVLTLRKSVGTPRTFAFQVSRVHRRHRTSSHPPNNTEKTLGFTDSKTPGPNVLLYMFRGITNNPHYDRFIKDESRKPKV